MIIDGHGGGGHGAGGRIGQRDVLSLEYGAVGSRGKVIPDY